MTRLHASIIAFASAFSFIATTLAWAAPINEVWHTPNGASYRLLGILADLDHNGVLDMVTREQPDQPQGSIAVRSATTGLVEGQTSSPVRPDDVVDVDLDGDGREELLYYDNFSLRLVCVDFTGSALTQRWSIAPFPAFNFWLADLDGNGRQYIVFENTSVPDLQYAVYDRNGALVGNYSPPAPRFWVRDFVVVDDVDHDGRDEVLLGFRDNSGGTQAQWLSLLESTAPVGVASTAPDLKLVALGAGYPNPAGARTHISYSMPNRGPATLRMLDVGGRAVRTLVDGDVPAGMHEATWDGRDDHGRSLPAGTYWYELNANGTRVSRSMVRLR